MADYQPIFRPHHFAPHEYYIDLYHVYDNLSRTPFQPGVGIQYEDPDTYTMNAWHVITPRAMKDHLNWYNLKATQFISFYGNPIDALRESNRRRQQNFVPYVGRRNPNSVHIAHVRLPRGTNVWAFSRAEMLNMMGCFGAGPGHDVFTGSGPSEWFVWTAVPEALVVNREQLPESCGSWLEQMPEPEA